MAVTNGWGQGVLNNLIEWGKGGVNNTISWGDIYADSYSGDTALTAADNLLLDQYSGAAAAYSVRKLSSSYSGSALRVRRSSDNAEQDIGFNGNDLDTSALTTFVGANDGFVVTWYDQSGSGLDATQATAADQPEIVSSGTLNTINGKAAIIPTSGRQSLLTGTSGSTSTWIFSVIDTQAVTSLQSLYNDTTIGGEFVFVAESGAATASVGTATYLSVRSNGSILGATTRNDIFTNYANQSIATINVNDNTFANYALGYDASLSVGIFNMQEFIQYKTDQSSNRAAIESNINTYFNIYWDGSQTGLLDDYPSASAAYSVRALNSAYTDPILRVRRSSDNAEQDIRALYDGNLDEEGLLNFVGANDGFVVTWYDQSGNGLDATQSTAANQPKIVSSGSILTQGGKSTIDFDGVNDYLSSVSNIGITGSSSRFMSVVGLRNIASPNDYYFGWGANGTGLACSLSTEPFLRFGSTTKDYSTTGTLSVQELITVDGNGINLNAYDLYHNGTIGTPATASSGTTTLNTTNSSLFVGTTINTALPLDGELQELIIWGNSQSNNRAAIESNINAYYDVYWDGTVSDPDAQAYLDEVVAQGGSLTNKVANEYNDFVLREKANSRYSKIKRLYPFLGGVIDSARVDAVTLAQATNNNFVNADVDSLIGVTPDGSTKSMVDSPVNSIINSVVGSQFGAFLKGATITNPTTFPAYYLGQLNTGIPSYFGAYKNASNTTSNGYSGGNVAIGNISSSGSNVSVIAARYSLSSAYMIVDGSEGSEQTITVGSGITTNTLKLFATAVNTSSPSNHTSQPINTLFVSQFDTLQETKDFESSYKTFLTNIGAI